MDHMVVCRLPFCSYTLEHITSNVQEDPVGTRTVGTIRWVRVGVPSRGSMDEPRDRGSGLGSFEPTAVLPWYSYISFHTEVHVDEFATSTGFLAVLVEK